MNFHKLNIPCNTSTQTSKLNITRPSKSLHLVLHSNHYVPNQRHYLVFKQHRLVLPVFVLYINGVTQYALTFLKFIHIIDVVVDICYGLKFCAPPPKFIY